MVQYIREAGGEVDDPCIAITLSLMLVQCVVGWGVIGAGAGHKVHLYLERLSPRPNWDPPPPFLQARVASLARARLERLKLYF